MKRKWLEVIALVLTCALVCCGCLASLSLDEYGYVLFIGVDEGTVLPYEVTVALQRIEENGDSQKPSGMQILSTECRDIFESVDLLSASVPYEINLARVNAIVFGEKLAQNGKMYEFLDTSIAKLRMRYYINVMVTKGKAQEYFQGLSGNADQAIVKLQSSFMQYSRQTGMTPMCTISQWDEAADSKAYDPVVALCGCDQKVKPLDENDGQQDKKKTETGQQETGEQQEPQEPQTDLVGEEMYSYLPDGMIRQGGLQSILMGSAVFDGHRMVGVLNGQHTQALLMATGQFREGRVQLVGPMNETMSVTFLKNIAPHTEVDLLAGQARVEVSLIADIESPESIKEISTEEMERYLEDYLENEMRKTFLACRNAGADSFGMGKAAVASFSRNCDWESYAWDEAFKRLEAEFDVAVKLAHNPDRSAME